MRYIKLEPRCPPNVRGITLDPQPDWDFDTLISELNSIEKKQEQNAKALQFRKISDAKGSKKPFVMRILNDQCYVSDSDTSEDELDREIQGSVLNKGDIVAGALYEFTHETQRTVMEKNRNEVDTFGADLRNENDKFTSALAKIEKCAEAQQEMDKRLVIQYQRMIAEGLDDHLTAIHRNHEHKSQLEEKKIRDDAALEEAKRKEKALQEEQLRQEKIKFEAERLARLEAEKKIAEQAKEAVVEAERRAAKEAAEKVASEASRNPTAPAMDAKEADGSKEPHSLGYKVMGAESALRLEESRLKFYNEYTAPNKALRLGSSKDYRSHAAQIHRLIKTIRGLKENVRTKANELIRIFRSSSYPESVSVSIFADKIVSQCVNPVGEFNNAMFAYAHVIVLVTSKVPIAMDILLAELNRACIFTVPKYINYSKLAFETTEEYYKAIGYQEEDGSIETTDTYVARLCSYMKLYGALVQTDGGVQNLHGIKEGWAWFARFLNALPANLYTAAALQSFLEMTGFALHTRYKGQFKKLLSIISHKFLNALGDRGDPKLNKIVITIRSYLESQQFLKEPEGRHLLDTSLSRNFF